MPLFRLSYARTLVHPTTIYHNYLRINAKYILYDQGVILRGVNSMDKLHTISSLIVNKYIVYNINI